MNDSQRLIDNPNEARASPDGRIEYPRRPDVERTDRQVEDPVVDVLLPPNRNNLLRPGFLIPEATDGKAKCLINTKIA